jgi:hypothetical protein
VVAAAWGARALAQSQGQLPRMPMPSDQFPPQSIGGPMPQRTLSTAERMKMNQEQIKKNMVRLKEAVDGLEKEFATNNTTTVLSMAAVRKTEEIEKLAREIRGLMRG